MALSSKERSARAAAKRKASGEEILRLPVRPGTRHALEQLMAWHGIEQKAEAMSNIILNLYASGPSGSAPFLPVARHEIHVSENVARNIRSAGAQLAAEMDQSELE